MIPDEAVEAAHKAWREQAAQDGSIFEYNLRAAIEAAAPHLVAAAWDEGAKAAWARSTPVVNGRSHTLHIPDGPTNPYRQAK